MDEKKPSLSSVNTLALLGMMSALVFASNFLRITMPLAVAGTTSFTLANILCCLSGLLLGPLGGLASGIGSALYDLFNPLYAPECWITFLTKGAMGLAAGLVMGKHRVSPRYGRALAASAVGCAVYYALYFLKSYLYGLFVYFLTQEEAVASVVARFPASAVNAAIAIAFAPPLCLAIDRALARSHLRLP